MVIAATTMASTWCVAWPLFNLKVAEDRANAADSRTRRCWAWLVLLDVLDRHTSRLLLPFVPCWCYKGPGAASASSQLQKSG